MLNGTLSPAFAQNNVPVVLAANNLFAPYTGVFIRSLLDHANEKNNYDIIILNRDISEENERLLKSLAAGHANVSIRFYDPSPLFVSFNYVDEEHNWPLEIFYKITAPHILKYSGRIVVVDVDTLLRTDIARLMDEDLESCCVGGVSDAAGIYISCLLNKTLGPTKIRARDYWQNICGFGDWKNWGDYKDYVNGGLLLFDCNRYVREVAVETILNTVQQGSFAFPEQDALQILMKGKIKPLDLAWNVLLPSRAGLKDAYNRYSKIYDEIYDEMFNENAVFQRAHEGPYLLHWAARPKPWVCPDVPWGSEWWQTALRTPFVGHIIARMIDELGKRRQYYIRRYGKEGVDVWDPTPKGIDRTKKFNPHLHG